MSLLVMPGMGHWYLGKRRAGALLAAGSMTALLYPLTRYVWALSDAMETLAQMDPNTLPAALSALNMAWAQESGAVLIGLGLFIVCWLGGALDLLRTPKQKELT